MVISIGQTFPYLLFIILSLCNICMVSCTFSIPIAYEYNIMDLYTTDAVSMSAMAVYWTINGQTDPGVPKINACGSWQVLGVLVGFTSSDYIERVYPTVADHDIIYYSAKILAINGWQSGDTITVDMDGTLVMNVEPATIMSAEAQALCGGSTADDLSIIIAGKFYHTSSTLTLRLTSHITSASTTATFGIRGIRMSLGHRTSSDVQGVCFKYRLRTTPSNCPCENDHTANPQNPSQCIVCDASVLQCFGPGPDKGYGCAAGYTYDGSNCVPCPSNCQNCLSSNTSVCLGCNTNYILSWDSTCQTACNNYLRQEDSYQFCDVCQPGYAQYPNSTCLPSCPAPWKERILVESHFCDYPCGDSSIYYHTKDSTCSSACEYPYIVQDLLCVLNLSEDDTKQAQTISGGLTIGSQITGAASAVAGAFSSGNPASFCLATLSEMLHYIRYMKIAYPPKLQYILDQDQPALFDIVPDMPQQMINALPQRQLPEKFEQYQLPSSFIVNFWEPGITLTSLVIGVFLISCLELACWKWKACRFVFGNIRQTIKWNFCIMMFISYLEDIVFSTSFEFRTNTFDSFLSVFSFILCVLVNMIAMGVFTKMVAVIWTLQKARRTGSDTNRLERIKMAKHKLKNFEVLFEECKEGTLFQQCYMCIFVLKVYLFYFVIAFLFDYPRVQTVLITLLSLGMVLYLIILRPLKGRINLIQNIVQEFIILIVNICTLILSFLDLAGEQATGSRQTLGDILIDCNLAFSAFAVLCLFISLGMTFHGIYHIIKEWYIKRKARRYQKKTSTSSTVTKDASIQDKKKQKQKDKPLKILKRQELLSNDTSVNLELMRSSQNVSYASKGNIEIKDDLNSSLSPFTISSNLYNSLNTGKSVFSLRAIKTAAMILKSNDQEVNQHQNFSFTNVGPGPEGIENVSKQIKIE